MDTKKLIGAIIAVTAFAALIVGATYAFFSASGGSANNAVVTNATTLANLGFTSSHSKIATNLVPVASENEHFSRYPGTSAGGCIDDLGNEICSVYEFTITNTASVAQTIYVSFVPSQNTFDNLYFAAFNTTAASAIYDVATGSSGSGNNFTLIPQTASGNSTLGHPATKLTKNSTASIEMPGLSTTLNAGGSVTYTVLVWLQETGANQNSEQGKQFKAGINVTTANGGTGVTGIIGDNYVYTVNLYDENATGYNSVYIGQAISSSISQYTTASSAMTAFNHPTALKHKIGNYSGWCIIMNNNTSNCLYTALSESDCNTVLSQAPNDGNTYTCNNINAHNVVTESYVVFTITPEMAANNNGMQAGTYELKGGDGGSSFLTNAKIIYDAFGGIGCSGDSNLPDTYNPAYNPNPSSNFNCGVSGLSAYADSYGDVNAHGDDWDCYVNIYGDSGCDEW